MNNQEIILKLRTLKGSIEFQPFLKETLTSTPTEQVEDLMKILKEMA